MRKEQLCHLFNRLGLFDLFVHYPANLHTSLNDIFQKATRLLEQQRMGAVEVDVVSAFHITHSIFTPTKKCLPDGKHTNAERKLDMRAE